MFDLGFLELLTVALVGLLILGPERLPIVITKFSSWLARARYFGNNLKNEFEREANLSELRLLLKEQEEGLQDQVNSISADLTSQKTDLLEPLKQDDTPINMPEGSPAAEPSPSLPRKEEV